MQVYVLKHNADHLLDSSIGRRKGTHTFFYLVPFGLLKPKRDVLSKFARQGYVNVQN